MKILRNVFVSFAIQFLVYSLLFGFNSLVWEYDIKVGFLFVFFILNIPIAIGTVINQEEKEELERREKIESERKRVNYGNWIFLRGNGR